MDRYYVEDWALGHEGTTGRRRSELTIGKECPTKEDWEVWKKELTRLHSTSWALPMPLGEWKHKTYRKRKY